MGGGGGSNVSGYESIIGGALGGIGDIVQARAHNKLRFPNATNQENRLRQMSMQDLEDARRLYYGGAGLYNQTLPDLYNAIPGFQADVSYDPQAQADYQQAYGDVGNRLNLENQLAQQKAALKGTKAGGGRRQAARQTVKATKQQLKGMPALGDLNRRLYGIESQGPQMKITKKAPTQTDQNAQAIQDQLSNRMLTALNGGNANPLLEHDIQQQQLAMQGNLQNAMGGDWASSSPGIEAQARQNLNASMMRDASNRQDIANLYPEQLAGQHAGYTFGQLQQQMLTNPSFNAAAMGHNLTGFIGPEAAAQSPFQFDRSGQFSATGANWSYGDPYGHALQQSGDRWIQAAGAAGGGGGGGGTQYASPQQQQPYYGNSDNSGIGQGAYGIDNFGGY